MSPSTRTRLTTRGIALLVAVAVLVPLAIWRMAQDGVAPAAVAEVPFQTGVVKVAGVGKKPQPGVADQTAADVRALMQDYFQAAFVNPSVWRSGDYAEAWKTMTPEAAAAAERHVDVLTLGPDAGEAYSSLEPQPSLFGLRLLTDRHGKPAAAVGLVTFTAEAVRADGSPETIVRDVRFTLEPTGKGWRITGFQAAAADRGPGSPSASPAAEPTVGRAHPASAFPAYAEEGPIHVLLIGDSYRAGQSHLADSIHVVSLDPTTGAGTILGIPRDSWVPIAGHGQQKINEAYAFGGPELMIGTVEDLTGLRMDYYAVTTFEGFIQLIKDIGGLEMRIPYAISDTGSKAHFRKGKTTLGGKDALRLARSRYDVPNGDFSRQHNEGLMLLAMQEQFRDAFRRDASALIRYLAAGMNGVETDLSTDEILALAYLAAEVDARDVTNIVVPGKIGEERGQSIVRIEPEAQAIFEDLADNGVLDDQHAGADV